MRSNPTSYGRINKISTYGWLKKFNPLSLSPVWVWSSLSSSEIVASVGDYTGTQLETKVLSSSGATTITSAHIVAQTVVSKVGTATVTVSTGTLTIGTWWVTDLVLSDGTHYKLQAWSGSTAYDSSASANHGTIVNPSRLIIRNKTITNYANKEGYTISGAVVIPRRNGTNVNAIGGALTATGKVRPNLKLIKSNCISMNGSSSWGLMNTALNATTSYNITVQFTMENSGTGIIFVLDGRNASNDGVAILRASGTIRCYHNASAIDTGVTIVSGQIYTVRAVWDGVNIQAYVDGVLKATVANSTTITGQPNCEIGVRNPSTQASFLQGKVFNLSMTLNGVTKHYPIAEGAASPTSYASGDSTKTITRSNCTWSTQDSYHYNINNGFSFSWSVRLPYMVSWSYTNPVQPVDNGAETLATMTQFREELADIDVLYNQSTYASNEFDPSILAKNSNNEFFVKDSVTAMYAYSPALTWSNLAKMNKYVWL